MTQSQHHYLVVMAGGSGTRLWPLSRESKPKQFLKLSGGNRTMIQETLDRVRELFPLENVYILTNQKYRQLVVEQVGDQFNEEQIVLEPSKRNTAPCLLLATLKIYKRDPKGKIVVLPSDHLITNNQEFINDIQFALSQADKKRLITFGIKPHYPSTDYGYIEVKKSVRFTKVVQFTEKPNFQIASNYLKKKTHLWNAGIFVWKAEAFLEEFTRWQPRMYGKLFKGNDFLNTEKEDAFLNREYPLVEDISIDYALLELSKNVYVLRSNFDWTDLGNWKSVYDILDKDRDSNVLIAQNGHLSESSNSLIRVEGNKKVIASGLDDFIVIDTPEGLLISPKENLDSLRRLLQ